MVKDFLRFGLIFLLGIIWGNNISAGEKDNFTFLFLGDLHYKPPAYNSAKTVENIVKDIEEKGYKVDFVCHIGDLIENQKGSNPISLEEGAEQWKFALSHIKKTFDIPFFMCLGNHDWYGDNTWFGGKKNIEKFFFPFISEQLGRTINKPFYSFHWGNSYFLFTNHLGFDYGWDKEQEIWLKKSLSYAEGNSAVKHVFIFGHPHLWNLDHFRFNEQYGLLKIISKYKKVDAYFCGHYHRQAASVWKFGSGRRFIQITGCPTGEGKILSTAPSQKRSLILNPPPSKRGYLRRYGGASGYFLVSVKGKRVIVSFDIIGGKREWEFYWEKPGEIVEVKAPVEPDKYYLKQKELRNITEARLYLFPYTPEVFHPEKPELEVFFNGKKVGVLPRITDWTLGGRNFIDIPPSLVKMKNRIVIPNPRREAFGVRDCCLWVKLKNGKEVLTDVYPYVLFSLPWKQIYMDFGLSHPTAGVLGSSIEENVPEELIRCVRLGEPISFELNFKEVKR